MIPYSKNINPSYENFKAICPYVDCGFENVFNRATDLETFRFITFKEVTCESCKRSFNINCDYANNIYEYLIYDCYELLKEKKYMFVILNCSQSFEAFFSLVIRSKYLYNPFQNEVISLDQLNYLAEHLVNTISSLGFNKLRNLFLRSNFKEELLDYSDIEDTISSLEDRKYQETLSDNKICEIINPDLSKILIEIKNFEINSLRNKVVHQSAYRPILQEAEACLQKTRQLIFGYRRISKDYFKRTFSLTPL